MLKNDPVHCMWMNLIFTLCHLLAYRHVKIIEEFWDITVNFVDIYVRMWIGVVTA